MQLKKYSFVSPLSLDESPDCQKEKLFDIVKEHHVISQLNDFTDWTVCIDTNLWVFGIFPRQGTPKKVRVKQDFRTGFGKDERRILTKWNAKLHAGLFTTAEVLTELQNLHESEFRSTKKSIGGIEHLFEQIYLHWTPKGILFCDKNFESYPKEILGQYLFVRKVEKSE